MSLHVTFVDLLVVLIILGSTAYAIWKGFIAETLSIIAWAAGAFAALYLGQWAATMVYGLIRTWWIAIVLGYAAVFLVVFIPLSFAAYRFADSIRRSPVGPIDRILGATFGIVRGLAVVGIAYLVFTAFVKIDDQPAWLTEARFLPLIRTSGEVVLALLPNQHLQTRAPDSSGPPPKSIRDLIEHPTPVSVRHRDADVPRTVRPKPHAKPGKKSYGAHERRELDRLFETTGTGDSSKP